MADCYHVQDMSGAETYYILSWARGGGEGIGFGDQSHVVLSIAVVGCKK